MLKIVIPKRELWDPINKVFVTKDKETSLSLEHSLVSISKWEAKWHKPFLGQQKTTEEIIDYVKCMTLTQNVDDEAYQFLTDKNVKEITEYIDNPMTATWFGKTAEKGRKRIITSELIYYWMIALQIPMECQKWHINRLITLIKVCEEESKAANGGKKTKKTSEMYAERNAIMEANKKRFAAKK